jgi:tRNA(Arg) A34 adenosine deaminase TadA
MTLFTRRMILLNTAAVVVGFATRLRAEPSKHQSFIAEAFRMKDEAVRAGDQPYGAVVVREGRIIGFGPSRVVLKNDPTAHAEREAIRAAQARLGTTDLSGCVLYSSSRPCGACEAAAFEARIASMVHGPSATDAGPPQRFN